MKYLYCILRLFFTPKWDTLAVEKNEILSQHRVTKETYMTGTQHIVRQECVFCGTPHFEEFRTRV